MKHEQEVKLTFSYKEVIEMLRNAAPMDAPRIPDNARIYYADNANALIVYWKEEVN